jgi:hypothetical protein
MKKILLILTLSLICLIGFSQNNIPLDFSQTRNSSNVKPTIVTNTQVYTDWQLSNNGGWGIPSFYWKVNRTLLPTGYYQFDIFFQSNSYRVDGTYAHTYLTGVYVKSDGYFVRNEPSWVLFKEPYSNQLLNFISLNPTPIINITWQSMIIN